jgi:hypothetical protein
MMLHHDCCNIQVDQMSVVKSAATSSYMTQMQQNSQSLYLQCVLQDDFVRGLSISNHLLIGPDYHLTYSRLVAQSLYVPLPYS